MLPFVSAAGLAFGAIFIAEFGDKSQLLILAFASRYAARPVVLGLVLAAAAIQGVSVAARPLARLCRTRPLRSSRASRSWRWLPGPCAGHAMTTRHCANRPVPTDSSLARRWC